MCCWNDSRVRFLASPGDTRLPFARWGRTVGRDPERSKKRRDLSTVQVSAHAITEKDCVYAPAWIGAGTALVGTKVGWDEVEVGVVEVEAGVSLPVRWCSCLCCCCFCCPLLSFLRGFTAFRSFGSGLATPKRRPISNGACNVFQHESRVARH